MYDRACPGSKVPSRPKSMSSLPRGGWSLAVVGKTLAGLVLLALATGGCPPTENVLVDAAGQSIRLNEIDRIVQNTDLTEEQKRQGLRDLGIADDELVELLLNQ